MSELILKYRDTIPEIVIRMKLFWVAPLEKDVYKLRNTQKE